MFDALVLLVFIWSVGQETDEWHSLAGIGLKELLFAKEAVR